MQEDLEAAIETTKQALLQADWWEYVQNEVKKSLEHVIDNVERLGIPFRDAFVYAFRYKHAHRLLAGEAWPNKVPSALFGQSMPEEAYQSGIQATKFVLDLDDWFLPNDADVQACMHLCQQIDVLQQYRIIHASDERLVLPYKSAYDLKGANPPTIEWNFESGADQTE